MADGRVEFEIVADSSRASASIDQITNDLQNAGKQWENNAQESTEGISNSFSSMLKGIAGAISAAKIGQMLLNIGKDAISAASDLEEVQNVVDVTFGADSNKIETWAKNAGTQFGLTETQAKRFTSTLGAMMKSAGMSGSEIADISTDLSGLAADMASFYNLDFDTAFNKIRSGISGETEPLKQLGINMSVANLEAYALQQGLSKTFSEMTQGEQTMLRYQYLMQATSDAQGDFSRTSDGYANGLRALETNIESLKTKLGEVLLPVVNDVVQGINNMMSALTQEHGTTVLDEFAAIDLNAQEKITAVKATAEQARTLTDVLNEIGDKISSNKTDASKMLDRVPTGSKLNPLLEKLEEIETKSTDGKNAVGRILNDVPSGEQEFKSVITSLDGVVISATEGKTAVKEILDDAPKGENADLKAVKDKVEGIGTTAETTKSKVGKLISDAPKTEEVTKAFDGVTKKLDEVTTKADEGKTGIGDILKDAPNDSAVDTAFGSMITKANGVVESVTTGSMAIKDYVKEAPDQSAVDEKLKPLKDGLDDVGQQAEQLGTDISGGLTDATQAIASDNALWLETCRQLVKTIPGLNSIINTETGEIKGGTQAIYDYIDAWEEAQKGLILQSAHEQKKSALDSAFSQLPELELDKTVAEYRVKKARDKLQEIYDKYGLTLSFDEGGAVTSDNWFGKGLGNEQIEELETAIDSYETLLDNSKAATTAYNEQKAAYDEAVAAYKYEGEVLAQTYDQAIENANEWTEETKEANREIVNSLKSTLDELEDYAKGVHDSVLNSVNSTIKSFDKIQTPAQKAMETGTGEIATAQSMLEGLNSQLAFMQKYTEDLEKAKAKGVSDEVLATLTDGSVESADYLSALANATDDQVQQINEKYKAVEEGKENLANTLTQQKLTVDETYQAMYEKAKEAVANLNLSEAAAENSGNTIAGIAQGIADHVPDVKEQVDAIIAQLERLNGYGIDVDFGEFGNVHIETSTEKPDGSNRSGLNNVPYDGYLAELHQGEAVLTAQENKIWQGYKSGIQNGTDYDTLGSIMRDNVQAGGNVYLDGRTVGQVISDRQGAQYRSLTRSGWQNGTN